MNFHHVNPDRAITQCHCALRKLPSSDSKVRGEKISFEIDNRTPGTNVTPGSGEGSQPGKL